MSEQVHQHWGRVIDTYDGTYLYDVKASRDQLVLSQQVMDELHSDGAKAIDKLCALGKSTGKPDWNNPTNQITLPLLKSLFEYTVFTCSLSKLGNPLVIRGCIKLLKSITRSGKPSPFSYEYGHLCFRILLLAYDYCVLKLTDRHNSWMSQATWPENQLRKEGYGPLLSATVSVLIEQSMVGDDNELYSRFTRSLPWTDSYKGPLIKSQDVCLLAQILDSDWNHLLLFVRSNYALRLSAILYTMIETMHRTPTTRKNRPFIQSCLSVYQKYALLAPESPSHWGWQHDYVIEMSKKYAPKEQKLDAEDSKLVLRAYIDRLTILSDSSPIHPRVTSPFAAELLEYVLTHIGDGCESLIPDAIRATLLCMRGDVGCSIWSELPTDAICAACIRLFGHIKRLFEYLVQRSEVTRHTILHSALHVLFEKDLISLFVRTKQTGTIEEYLDDLLVVLDGNVSPSYFNDLAAGSAVRSMMSVVTPSFYCEP
ncbi:unnamed protein product [Rhizoctonia solani]|uniref:Uncharacterized protein n=1 Tax=Rhizoctonia solani TaxID=456999 RepID=A0A8H3HZ82_9AGAM|nr:unnamed protein product [Rhizoctonia solani]